MLESCCGVGIYRYECVDSTQDELRRHLDARMKWACNDKSSAICSAKSHRANAIWQGADAYALDACAQDLHMQEESLCIIALSQTHGRGRRGHTWVNESALMFSFAYLAPLLLPDDVPSHSVAIFLGCVIRDILREYGSHVWLKYPNDLYIDTQDGAKKIGGILVEHWKGVYLCGVGINKASATFGALEVMLDEYAFFTRLFTQLRQPPSWKQIFSKYQLEFWRNYPFAFHVGEELISLRDALLLDDGSVKIGDRVLYNL